MRPATLALALLTACSLRPLTSDGATESTTLDPTPATSDPATSDPATSGCNFLDCLPDLDAPAEDECDGWIMPLQDCPEGQKCTFDDGFWGSHCVDVVPDPKGMYEPCQLLMGDTFSGHDDCGAGLFCWDVDPETGVGLCIGFCHGPRDNLTCSDPAANCWICQECALGLCIPSCNPLAQDCPPGDLCIPDLISDGFTCILDASGDAGQAFDPCEFANTCDPGLFCANPTLAKECDPMASGCCLPFCDLTMPTCPGNGLTCIPWYEPGLAPAGLENVGLCGLPP